MGPRGST
jgi:hypothetical protein